MFKIIFMVCSLLLCSCTLNKKEKQEEEIRFEVAKSKSDEGSSDSFSIRQMWFEFYDTTGRILIEKRPDLILPPYPVLQDSNSPLIM